MSETKVSQSQEESKELTTIPKPISSKIQILAKSAKLEPIVTWCQAYLSQTRKNWPDVDNMCLLFDIDDTILFQTQQGFVVPNVMTALYQMALKHRYKVCFVTARIHNPANVEFTQKQLHDAGFGYYDNLYLMPEEFLKKHPNWSYYKTYARNLIAKNYSMVLNMGDNWSDLLILEPFEGVYPGTKELVKSGNKTYVIFRSPDVSWVSVKLPLMEKQ